MRWTDQQEAVFAVGDENVVVEAVAGAGKTSTLVELTRRNPRKRYLYLAFNRSVAEEARKKFPRNVTVVTAHALAYRAVGKDYKVVPALKFDELEHLTAGSPRIRGTVFYTARKVLADAVNSSPSSPEDAEKVIDKLCERRGIPFKKEVSTTAKAIFREMLSGNIPIIHDFYLLLYRWTEPKLPFDAVLFDEGQDANPVMLDIFLSQDCQKIIVGDSAQAIYGWRGAVDSLSFVRNTGKFKRLPLSVSFRFGELIAESANVVLDYKNMSEEETPVFVTGVGGGKKDGSHAYLGRTNAGIMASLFDKVAVLPFTRLKVYVEGGTEKLFRLPEYGISILDILNFKRGVYSYIPPFLEGFGSYDKFKEFVEENADYLPELNLFVSVVEKKGVALYRLVNAVKDAEVKDKREADLIYSTVHKAKGLEYDKVTLLEDFPSPARLSDLKEEIFIKDVVDEEDVEKIKKINEEFNILYVALTRAREELILPPSLEAEVLNPARRIVELRNSKKRKTPIILTATEEKLPRYVLAFDFETTGLKGYAVECCFLLYDREKKAVVDGLATGINPLVPLPFEITMLFGVEEEKLKNFPTFVEVYPRIKSLFEKADIITAHNIAFDLAVMDRELKRLGYSLSFPPKKYANYNCFCTCWDLKEDGKKAKKLEEWITDSSKEKIESALSRAVETYGYNPDWIRNRSIKQHNAVWDAICVLGVFNTNLNRAESLIRKRAKNPKVTLPEIPQKRKENFFELDL